MRIDKFATILAIALAVGLGLSAADKPKEQKGEQSQEAAKMEDLLAKKEYQKAIDLGLKFIENYTKAGKEADLTIGLYVDMGVAYYNLKDYTKALEYFDTAYARNMFDPQVPQILEYKATCYHELKQDDKVVETYNTILQLDPTKKELKYKLARLLEDQKKLEEAIAIYEELANAEPGFNDVAYDLGVVYFQQKNDLAKAQVCLEKANQATPGKEHILLALSQVLLKGQKYKEAVPIIQEYLKVSTKPDYKTAMMKNLALCQMKEKQYKEAIATYDQFLQVRPNDETALLNKAQCFIDQKDTASAIPVLETYLSVSKNDAKKKEVADLLKSLKSGGKKK